MTVPVGVVGVGTMGKHHARVYQELSEARLVGVTDADSERAEAVAADHGTRAVSTEELLSRAEAISVAVPSQYHTQVGLQAIEAGVHTLVEKPIATTLRDAEDLIKAARASDVTLHVGHVERFNPAVRAVAEFVDGLDIVAVDARRLGPPVGGDRQLNEGVVLDLMIHDIDVVRSLVGADVRDATAAGSPDGEHVTAALKFENDVVGSLTASRTTQKKVRELTLTATDCLVTVDYIDRAVTINRRSRPSYMTNDGDLRYRNEQVIERPTVDNGEPLKKELAAFLETVTDGAEPVVSAADGYEALSIAYRIRDAMR